MAFAVYHTCYYTHFSVKIVQYIWEIEDKSNVKIKVRKVYSFIVWLRHLPFWMCIIPTWIYIFPLSDFSVYVKHFCYRMGQLTTKLLISMKCTVPLRNRYLQIHAIHYFTVHCETLVFIPFPDLNDDNVVDLYFFCCDKRKVKWKKLTKWAISILKVSVSSLHCIFSNNQ